MGDGEGLGAIGSDHVSIRLDYRNVTYHQVAMT